MRVISYGGGVQSTALVVLAVQGDLGPVDAALFSNVGDDSEHPDTVRYVREVAIPWVASQEPSKLGGVIELHRVKRDGTTETLMGRMQRNSKSLPIPIRGSETGKPGKRSCTVDFKAKVIAKWLRGHGANRKAPADVMLGISWDEIERLGNKKTAAHERLSYPLIDMRLTREDCKRIIERAGLPVPPKSACYFCPFKRPSVWSRMRRDEPLLFYKAADLEAMLNERRDKADRDPVYLTRFGKPLATAIQVEQDGLDFGEGPGETCDEGYCWT